MDQSITNYNDAAMQSEAMVQDYYMGKPPFCGNPACIPFVPTEDDGTPVLDTDDVLFRYIELTLPDGRTVLAITTPWPAKNGPGKRYRAVEV